MPYPSDEDRAATMLALLVLSSFAFVLGALVVGLVWWAS